MMSRTTLVALAVIALALGGVATKAARYAAPEIPSTASPEARLVEVFAATGWTVAQKASTATGQPYPWLLMSKPACGHSVTVSILSANPEVRRLVEVRQGGDVAFVMHGRVVGADQLSRLTAEQAAIAVGFHREPAGLEGLPLLAISPRPQGTDPNCRLPFQS